MSACSRVALPSGVKVVDCVLVHGGDTEAILYMAQCIDAALRALADTKVDDPLLGLKRQEENVSLKNVSDELHECHKPLKSERTGEDLKAAKGETTDAMGERQESIGDDSVDLVQQKNCHHAIADCAFEEKADEKEMEVEEQERNDGKSGGIYEKRVQHDFYRPALRIFCSGANEEVDGGNVHPGMMDNTRRGVPSQRMQRVPVLQSSGVKRHSSIGPAEVEKRVRAYQSVVTAINAAGVATVASKVWQLTPSTQGRVAACYKSARQKLQKSLVTARQLYAGAYSSILREEHKRDAARSKVAMEKRKAYAKQRQREQELHSSRQIAVTVRE